MTLTVGGAVSTPAYTASATIHKFCDFNAGHTAIVDDVVLSSVEIPFVRVFTDELAACAAMTGRLPCALGGGWWPNLLERGYRFHSRIRRSRPGTPPVPRGPSTT